jgi:hypothetical protein
MKLRISKLEQLQYPSVLRRLVTVVTPFAMLSPSIAERMITEDGCERLIVEEDGWRE